MVRVLLFGFFLGFSMITASCSSQRSNKANQNQENPPVGIEMGEKENQKEKPNGDVVRINDYKTGSDVTNLSKAVFAGGCFWCTEASFQQIEGVVESISGYSGGHVDFPTYRSVCEETTGHAEAIFIYYDESKINYDELLDIFFDAHDPTTLNRQGPDVGESYRSAIFTIGDEQEKLVAAKIETLNKERFDNKIVTQVVPYEEFWVAEAYHQDYFWSHPTQSYVANVSKPKVDKVAKKYKSRLKSEYKR